MLTDPEEDYRRGFVPFLDCKIYLDSHPLIPRTETEYWVEKAIENLSPTMLSYEDSGGDPILHCLDLFAGSGAIGVAILKHVPHAEMDFGEIDATHFPTIRKNLKENGIPERRARIIHTDVWSGINDAYDLVLANPPYLSSGQSRRIQPSVLTHEPHNALYADEGGFALIRKTIEGAQEHLTKRGELYIEHEPEHAPGIARTAKTAGLSAHTVKDQFGLLRYSIIRRH